jgi:transcriptional regulator GlxA family with amidase domain
MFSRIDRLVVIFGCKLALILKQGPGGVLMPTAYRTGDFSTQQEVIQKTFQRFLSQLDQNAGAMPFEVRVILRYVHAHLFEPGLTVHAIRKACGLANNNVTTRFRRATGMGIREYVVNHRLAAAARVLSTQSVNIYLLAAAAGYTEEAFSKAFKNQYDCTPLQYHTSNYHELYLLGREEVREIDKSFG